LFSSYKFFLICFRENYLRIKQLISLQKCKGYSQESRQQLTEAPNNNNININIDLDKLTKFSNLLTPFYLWHRYFLYEKH
jgi:hypothetical protein